MMAANISPLFSIVNKLTVLTISNRKNSLSIMKYGERLKLARTTMKLKQADLHARCGVNQSLISQLENSNTATGSEYTPRLARALGVSVDWLADEIGEMLPANTLSDPAQQLLARLSTMTEREQYRIVRMVDAFADDAAPNDCDTPGHCSKRAVDG